MSTTRSTSDTFDAGPYTVTGGSFPGKNSGERPGLSVVLLNRGTRQFRSDIFEDLCRLEVNEVISLESAPCPHDAEPLVKAHSGLRFMIFSRKNSTGARLNAAMREAQSSHVLVVRSDTSVDFPKDMTLGNHLCSVPVFYEQDGQVLPSVLRPVVLESGAFETVPDLPSAHTMPTLIPWDFCGIYRRAAHLALGGFDEAILEPWWQMLDYGTRSWLWGEEIRVCGALKLKYLGHAPVADGTPGPGYRRFFLKNLGMELRGDKASLPASCWRNYLRSSGDSAASSREEWKEIRLWVEKHRLRFVKDIQALSALWDWEARA